MNRDRVDRVADRVRRDLPHVSPWALEIIGRIERLTALFKIGIRPYDRSVGVSAGELDVLAALRLEGPPYELTPSVIAARVVMTSGGATKRLDRLEARGFVRRRPDPSDRRGSLIALTENGVGFFDDVAPALVERAEGFLVDLDQSERETLAGLLRKLLLSEPFAKIDPEQARVTRSARRAAQRPPR